MVQDRGKWWAPVNTKKPLQFYRHIFYHYRHNFITEMLHRLCYTVLWPLVCVPCRSFTHKKPI